MFPALNFTVINAVPPVVMSPAVVRANLWQRTVVVTLNVPSNLLLGSASIQMIASAHNESVGSLPSEPVAVDPRCSCAHLPFTIRSPGVTRVRSVFVQGPSDLTGFQQVAPRAHRTIAPSCNHTLDRLWATSLCCPC
jgi:hypothetical protein